MKNQSCAFTGHRPAKFPWKYDEADSRCIALKSALAEQIRLLAQAGVTQFLSGMAEAADTWSALSVLALREKNPALKLHCILPCTTQADKCQFHRGISTVPFWSAPIRLSMSAGSTTKIVCWSATVSWWNMLLSFWLFTTGNGVAGRRRPCATLGS